MTIGLHWNVIPVFWGLNTFVSESLTTDRASLRFSPPTPRMAYFVRGAEKGLNTHPRFPGINR